LGIVRYEPLHETALVEPTYVSPVALPDIDNVFRRPDLSFQAVIVFVAVRVIEYASLPSSHSARPVFKLRPMIVVTDAGEETAEPMGFTAVTTMVYAVRGDKPENTADLDVVPLSVVGVVATPFSVYV
jgi:hypothetical protein